MTKSNNTPTAPAYMYEDKRPSLQFARAVFPWTLVVSWFVFSAFLVVSGLVS